jgi:hypothetical protein
MQLVAGMWAAKALEQHLCKRFNDPDFLHVFIHITYIPTYANSAFKRF